MQVLNDDTFRQHFVAVARSAGSFEPTRTRPSACNGILSVIPLIAAFIFLQRFWQSGLTAGGVKE